MIQWILSLVLFVIFIALSGFHFYWLMGGSWRLDRVFPTKEKEASRVTIPKFATLTVALILFSFALLYLMKSGVIKLYFPIWISDYTYWIIPSIFILRAVGEFKYVGFFKKVKNTQFADADTKIFSPLCLSIGLIGFLIQILS